MMCPGHEVRQADKDRGANVADAAVGALGAVAQALPWVQVGKPTRIPYGSDLPALCVLIDTRLSFLLACRLSPLACHL